MGGTALDFALVFFSYSAGPWSAEHEGARCRGAFGGFTLAGPFVRKQGRRQSVACCKKIIDRVSRAERRAL